MGQRTGKTETGCIESNYCKCRVQNKGYDYGRVAGVISVATVISVLRRAIAPGLNENNRMMKRGEEKKRAVPRSQHTKSYYCP